MNVPSFEEIEKIVEEQGGPMDNMRVNLSKLERKSMQRKMVICLIAAAMALGAALMAVIYSAQLHHYAAKAEAAATEAVAERDRVMELLGLLESGMVIEHERTVDEYTTTTEEQTAEGDTAIINNGGTTVNGDTTVSGGISGDWKQGE